MLIRAAKTILYNNSGLVDTVLKPLNLGSTQGNRFPEVSRVKRLAPFLAMGKRSTERQTVKAMKSPSGVTFSKKAKDGNRQDVMNGLTFLRAPKVGAGHKFVGSHISIQRGVVFTSSYKWFWKMFLMLLEADLYKLVGNVATPSFRGKKTVWDDVYGLFSQ